MRGGDVIVELASRCGDTGIEVGESIRASLDVSAK